MNPSVKKSQGQSILYKMSSTFYWQDDQSEIGTSTLEGFVRHKTTQQILDDQILSWLSLTSATYTAGVIGTNESPSMVYWLIWCCVTHAG